MSTTNLSVRLARPAALLMIILAGTAVSWPAEAWRKALAAGDAPSTIVMPQKLVAGQGATLAVLTAEGRLAPGVAVEFSGGQRVTTDSTGRAFFTAPAEPGVLLAEIPGAGAGDAPAAASATVVSGSPSALLQLAHAPRLIALRDRFFVSGTGFQEAADGNRVRVGSQPAIVLAASPVSLVVLAGPGAAPGPAQLAVEAGGASAVASTTLVALELDSAKSSLAPKEKSKLLVRVRGTEQALELEARNLTPEIVRFSRGALRRVTTRGGADNTAAIEIEGLRQGEFAFSVRMVPPPSGLPDVEAALQYLRSARRLAPPRSARRVDKLIERLQRRPQDTLKVRNELEKMMAAKPEGQFGRLIEAAWEVLLNR